MIDLLIIGAGPAGAAAAIEAERAGLEALTIDKARFPRDKTCGDGLTTGALRQLDALGLDPADVPSWCEVSDVHIAGPNRRPRRFPLPAGRGSFAAIARRRELDAALVETARRAGAEIREGVGVEAVHVDDDGATVDLTVGSPVRCRHVVAADGMWSPTKKMLGVNEPRYLGEWHAFRQYFTGVSGPAATDLFVWFEPDLLPGYLWSFPLADGSANVGFGIRREAGRSVQDMKQWWPELLDRPHIREVLGEAVPEGPHRAWPIPARLATTVVDRGPVLWVGDAAAATDPMTGEGIGQALETGRLAVECIVAAGATGRSGSMYRDRLRAGMTVDHRLAGALSSVLANKHLAQASVTIAGATGWTRRNFARWLFEDYPRAVLATPRRWRRGLFTADGAYQGARAGRRETDRRPDPTDSGRSAAL